jgi:hypothetical protein
VYVASENPPGMRHGVRRFSLRMREIVRLLASVTRLSKSSP